MYSLHVQFLLPCTGFSHPAVLAYEVSYEYGMKTSIAGLQAGVSSHLVFRGFQQLPVHGTGVWNQRLEFLQQDEINSMGDEGNRYTKKEKPSTLFTIHEI